MLSRDLQTKYLRGCKPKRSFTSRLASRLLSHHFVTDLRVRLARSQTGAELRPATSTFRQQLALMTSACLPLRSASLLPLFLRSPSRVQIDLPGAHGPVVALGEHDQQLVHLLPTARTFEGCLPPNATAFLTETYPDRNIVHLHEDAWDHSGCICRSRLLARAGRRASRHLARKTSVRRIEAALYIPFLDQHHLHGASASTCLDLPLMLRRCARRKQDPT